MSRERILNFGPAGSGKSHAVLTIARRCPTSMFYVLDNDNAYPRLLDTDFVDVRARGNVQVQPVWEWDDSLAYFEKVSRGCRPDDWVVFDIFGDTWKQVQDWYAMQVHGQDLGDYFLQVRKGLADGEKTLGGFSGFTDWAVVNPQFNKLVKALLRCNGHLYCTAAIDKMVVGDDTDAANRALYTNGYKPVGQKHIGHKFQTLLMSGKGRGSGGSNWTLTTVKDRGRVEVDRMPWTDFAVEYLVNVAGWRVAMVEG